MAIAFNQLSERIEITGYSAVTPCTMADIYTADTGATDGRQLLDGTIDADPDTFDLGSKVLGAAPTQPWPSDSYAVPLKISCTARAGATCDIVGTDAAGDSISETGIDISSGSATTTKKFRTVDANGITVNGMTVDDDFDIHQDRWGVIGKMEKGTLATITSKQWLLEEYVLIGVSGTTGYFETKSELIYITRVNGFGLSEDSYIYVGELVNSQPANGSVFIWDCIGATQNYRTIIGLGYETDRGFSIIYDATFRNMNSSSQGSAIRHNSYSTGTSIIKNVTSNCHIISGGTLENCWIYSPKYGGVDSKLKDLKNIHIYNPSGNQAIASGSGTSVLHNIALYGTRSGGDVYASAVASYTFMRLADCIFSDTSIWGRNETEIFRVASINIKVVDEAGNAIENAKVEIKDTNDQVVSYDDANSIALFEPVDYLHTALSAHTSWLVAGFAVNDLVIPVNGNEVMQITAIAGTGDKVAIVTRAYYSDYPATDHTNAGGLNTVYKIKEALTNSNGDIPEQLIAIKRYERTSANKGSAPLVSTYTPHTLIIKKPGYKIYKKVFTIPDDDLNGIKWTIALKRPNLSLTETAKFED